MRKHLNKWNVFIVAVVIATAAWILPRSYDTTYGHDPPDEAVSAQADDMGLSYLEMTVRTPAPDSNDPVAYTNECPNPGQTQQRMHALTSAPGDGTNTDETEVSAPVRGTRSPLFAASLTAVDVMTASTSWGGLLRKANDAGSRSVPVA